MKLSTVRVGRFRNFVDWQDVSVEDDVTCFVGKNESGKTTVLHALWRLNPAVTQAAEFDLTTEYPRWRMSRDRRQQALEQITPVAATFVLSEPDLASLAEVLPVRPPAGTRCRAARSYANALHLSLECDVLTVVSQAAKDASLDQSDLNELLKTADWAAAAATARARSKELKDSDPARARTLGSFPSLLDKYSYLNTIPLTGAPSDRLQELLPKFFYFSSYDLLPGESDLDELSAKVEQGAQLTNADRAVLALLSYAGEKPTDLLDENYDSRKAELQAAGLDLSRKVFQYWKQNTDLSVVFDTDMVKIADPTPTEIRHRYLKIQLRDDRHGGVETNFETRSTGFRWFFSFLAAFSAYLESNDPVVVLLDEPGTSLHGDAQREFVRFIYDELGKAKQVLYTTHSQHMIDPARYDTIRAVHDRATRENPELAG